MKRHTLALPIGTGIAAMALFTTWVQADSVRYDDLNNLVLDMPQAAIAASDTATGKIIEIELEMKDAIAVWEIDVINQANQLVTLEIDGQTGEVLSTRSTNKSLMPFTNKIGLTQAMDIVGTLDSGVLVEAELENDDGKLIWGVELLDSSNHEVEFHVDATTGEILN